MIQVIEETCPTCNKETLALQKNGPHTELFCTHCHKHIKFIKSNQAKYYKTKKIERSPRPVKPPHDPTNPTHPQALKNIQAYLEKIAK